MIGRAPTDVDAEVVDALAIAPPDFGGGCSPFRAALPAELGLEQRAQVTDVLVLRLAGADGAR